MEKNLVIGYTSGVFDLFHIGHLNILRNAKGMCDYLVVGVSTDELVMEYKNKKPIIPFLERMEIIRNLKCVDAVVPQYDMDKLTLCKQLKANRVFVGGWYGTDKWDKLEEELLKNGIMIIYFPYTKNISSTMINSILDEKRQQLTTEQKESINETLEKQKEQGLQISSDCSNIPESNSLDEFKKEI